MSKAPVRILHVLFLVGVAGIWSWFSAAGHQTLFFLGAFWLLGTWLAWFAMQQE